jgi:hypothetical protein
MNRSEFSRAFAKTLAYIACGKLGAASTWGQKLVDMLRSQGVTIE